MRHMNKKQIIFMFNSIVKRRIVWICLLLLAITVISGRVTAANLLTQKETYREVLRLEKIDGQKEKALEMARQLLTQVPQQDPLFKDLQDVIQRLDAFGSEESLQKAIQFVTGKKTEVYCKDVGLVEVEGTHKDGATSRVILISSNRKLVPNSYSRVLSGDWGYELSSTYRAPMRSDLFGSGSAGTYKITEIRSRESGAFDRGTYWAEWAGGDSISNSYSTSGRVLEPAPVFLASDYHLWGNRDLGFLIEFKVGSSGRSGGRESGGRQHIMLESTRRVTDHLPSYSYRDAKGGEHSYKDCFKVRYEIGLKELRDNDDSFKNNSKDNSKDSSKR